MVFMKRLLFFLMAIIFAIQGWTQPTLNEGFEGTTFPPNDWTSVNVSGSVNWARYTSSTPRGTASASVNYATAGHENWLITPNLNVTSGLDTISFWIKTSTYYSGTSFSVFISSTTNDIASFNTSNPALLSLVNNNITTTWTKYSVPLSAYIGQNIYVGFRVQDQDGMRIMLDDVTGPNLFVPACPKPTSLQASNPTASPTSFDLGWTDASGSLWNIQYMPAAQTDWANATTISGVTTNPYNINGLNPDTDYKIRIQKNCGTELSDWTNSITYTTPCSILSVPTTTEEFNSVPPSRCWERKSGLLPASGPATLTSTTSGWNLNSYVTPSNANLNIYSTNKYWLISPSIDLGNGAAPMQLEFDVFYTDYGNANPIDSSGYDDRFAVVISTDNGVTWEAANAFIWSSDINSSKILGNITNAPTHVIIPMFNQSNSLPYTGTIKIGFYGESTVSNTDNDLHIDNFTILPFESCRKPSNVAVSSLTSTSANILFQENGSSATWQYVISSTANYPDNITPIPTTSNPILLTNLTPNTQYKIWIRSDCYTETSNWSNQLSFTTDALPKTIPFTCNFENQLENSAWRNLSGSVNNWAIGQAAGNGPTTQNTTDSIAAYISNDNGLSYAMTDGYIYSYGYRDIDFGTTPASYSLNFDWKCEGYVSGTSAYSGLIVFLRNVTDTLNPTGYPTYINDNLALLSQSSTWQNKEITIDNVSGVKRLIFYYFDRDYNYAPPAAIDNISVEALSCPRPFDITINSLSSTQAQIAWSSNIGNEWYFYYKTSFDAFYDSILVNTNTYTIQNLIPQATYTYYLRTKCGTELSYPTNIYTFTTPPIPCEAVTALPFTENFDSYGTTAGSFLSCWSRPVLNTTTPFPSINTAYSHTSPASIKFQSASASVPTYVITPAFGVDINTLKMKFWLKKEGTSSGSMQVGVMSSSSDTSTFELVEIITPSTSDWIEYEILFNNTILSGTNKYIAFKHVTSSSAWYYWIDDIVIDIIPTCLKPTALAASNPTSTGFDLTWTDESGSLYNIQYMTATETDWANATTISGVAKPYTFNTLNHSTSYKVRVQTNCTTEQSEWSAQITYTTACGTITELPWTEGFENTFVPAVLPGNKTSPLCWYIIDSLNSGTYFWKTSTSAYSGNNSIYMQGYASSTTTTTSYNNNDWLISPIITLTGSERLNFWAKKSSASYKPDLLIYAMDVSQGDLNPTVPSSNFILIGQVDTNVLSTTYAEYEFNLSSLVGDYRLAFVRKKIANGSVYIDDVKVSEIPTCLMPTAPQASNPTPTSFDLGWTDASGSLYNIQYMPSTQTDWANATTISGVNNPYTIIGLNSGTIYKIRVQTDCGTKQSEWSAPITYNTACVTITTLPYTESFDNYGTGSTIYPLCWSRLYNATTANPYITSTNFSSPGSMYFTAATGKNSFAITPQLDASIQISSLSAKFQLRTTNSTSKIIVGVLTNPADSLTFIAIDTLMPTASSVWEEFEVNFVDYTGDGQFIAFKSEYNTATNTCYVDDLTIYTTPSCERPSAISATSTSNSIVVNVTPAETTDNGWKVFFREANSANWDSLNIISNIATIPNLQSQTVYEIYAKTLCSDASYSSSNNSIFVETKQIPVSTPYVCNFEGQGNNGWIIRNGTSVNKWMIGTPVGARSNALFVSNNNANLAYAIGSQSVVIAEKLFNITSPDSLELSFDALVGGELVDDYLKVFLVDKDTVFSPSLAATYFSENSYSEGIIMQNESNNYINLIPATHLTTRFVSPGIGVEKKLIFVWRNDASAGNGISAYIDNVSLLNIITPYPPTNLQATPSITTSQLTWTAGAAEIGWQVRKGETGAVVDVSTIGYQANALSPGTQYTYYIRSNYGDNLYSIWVPISFRTLAIPQRVTTLAATEIGQTTANVHGTVIAGTDTIINQGFQYRVLGGDTNWTSVSATFDDTIAYNLTGLLPYAVYEFRAFASTAYVTINGRTQSFTTLPAPPSAITSPATLIEQTVATLNGIVTQGTRPLTTKGFEWRLVGATTWTTVTSTLTDDATTYNLTGLIPITNYEYRVFATTASEIVYGSIANFTTLAIVPPTVTTIPATSIAQTIATLNANIVLGSEIITEQGFEWRLSGASTWTTLTSTLNAGIITNNLTGLVASTDYEYRAYATTASGSVYGEIQSFTTLAIVPPTVITGEAIAVAQTIETINGTITAGSELVTNQGFEWRLLGESVWTPLTVSLVDNAMTYNLTALTANTNYEFRAFATTESTTTYGNIVAFRTLAMDPPVVITTAATLISQTSVTLNGSAMVVMAPITSQGFEWRLSGETTWTIIPTAIIDNNLIHNLTGLTAYTDYEFRAFATTSEGTTYGLTQSFKTLPIAPTVVTNPATSITQIIATLNGAVADGSETISAKGFEWRKVGATSWTNIILTENTLVYNLTGIVASTNYEFRAYATTESGSVYGITQTFTTLAIVPPTVVTNVATLVDQTTATINGAITAGSESILSQGFEWKLASASAWTQITSIPTSTITHNLTGLTPDRAYEFRAYATTESGTTYGTIQSFSTLVIPQAVVTNPANSITETNATLNAVVTSGSELLTSHGFEWKVSNSSTWTIVTSPLIGNALTYSLIGLTPNMDYEFRAYATTASGTIYGQIQNFTTLAIPTIVVTSSATSVAQTIATINGTITLGSKPLTSQGFEWKLASASTWTVVAKSLIGNTITHNLTGLTANTAYEFRAYAINASETIYGEVQSFTTLATVPTVVTNAATLVAQTTATLNGAITIGSESIIAQGFEWKLSSATAWIAQTSTLNGNAITHNLTGLNPNSAYQYRAYATTLSGTVYGTTQNFTTLAIVPPTVVTNAATLISQNTATLNGTVTIGSDEILVQGFEWKLATSSTWLPLTSTLTGNAITHNLIGLTPNTAYQFRAYVTTSAGTVSGTTQSFTTLAIVPPTVVTSVATAISQNIATLNGTITAGSELISSQGFEYKLTSSSTWIPIAANLNGNAITYNLLGLTPNSAYQFRAYATTFNGTVYGSTQTFTTLAIVPPTIVTSAATLIAQTSATLNGTITSGSEAIITQGFEWTLSSSNAWTITTEPLTGNAMTNILTGLNPNTSYKYRAYVITLSGTVYGQTQTFTTLSITPPTVLTSAATAITTNSATLNGTITAGTEAVISQGFEWRVFNTNIWMPITTTGSALTHNLLGLTPNESYEFRVYATTASGNVYGEIQDFTTLAIIPPTVVTNPPIVTSSREVTLSGTVISGSESILAQGFEWKEAGASQWTVVAGTLTGNTITYNLTGLTPNQSYRFRAGVVTESGITYGETQIFTTLGLNGVDGNEISIKMYPNPAKIQTKLIVSGISGDVKIILSDVQGRILSTVNTEAVSGVLEHTLDLNDLVEGVYYIRIQNSVINKTQKLIVK